MEGEKNLMKFQQRIESTLSEVPWTRSVAAGSLVVGAILLITGKRRSGLVVAAAGAAVTLLENPKAIKDAWDSMPRLVRASQDFLVRVEDFVDELNKQGIRLRKVLSTE
ncbi:MAG TPA: hypothetical protein VKT75_09070 [Acidobacteriaceae bacterium]|nr:hypothetical protein [Acidobacteriaceae bacterium]